MELRAQASIFAANSHMPEVSTSSMGAFSVYAASKAAARNLARGWATDLKERRIRINMVSPGVIVTPGYKTADLTDEQVQGFAAQMASMIPLGRAGEADEVAKTVLFLASDDSSLVNAAELVVDGGMIEV
jgi:NAD(P)-dependent dehydrogenase (short-subunit alcohol dehydrogenase family)